jgi:hypothetical protein
MWLWRVSAWCWSGEELVFYGLRGGCGAWWEAAARGVGVGWVFGLVGVGGFGAG